MIELRIESNILGRYVETPSVGWPDVVSLRKSAYTPKGQRIEVWQVEYGTLLEWQLDCCGFALDTWRNYGVSIYLDDLHIIFQEFFVWLAGDIPPIQGDLVVFYESKEETCPCHIARVFDVKDQDITLIHKAGNLFATVETLNAYSQAQNERHVSDPENQPVIASYRIYREINWEHRPAIASFFNYAELFDEDFVLAKYSEKIPAAPLGEKVTPL